MWTKWVTWIPFIGSAFSFPGQVCWRALKELAILWFISSLPIVLSIGLKMASGEQFFQAAEAEINLRAIFVYTSAFLAPVVYLLYERLVHPRGQIFAGPGWIVVATIAIVCASAWMFQNDRVKNVNTWPWLAYGMYIMSIYFWWLSIADARNMIAYSEAATREEDAFAEKAASIRGDSDGQ